MKIAPAYAKFGTVRERMGADTVNVVPHSHYQTKTGDWVALACTNDKMFERLTVVMSRPELASGYPTSAIRVQNRDFINTEVARWMKDRTLQQVLDETRDGGVPCAHIFSIRDIFEEPQYAARENLLRINDPRAGDLVVPAPVPKLSVTPATFQHAGRALGADNTEIYTGLLGLTEDDLRAYAAAGAI